MNKLESDADDHFGSLVDWGADGDDKDLEKEASWRALQDQMPKRSREDYKRERAHITDKRTAAKSYVNGKDFKNESKNINKKQTIRLTESDLHRIIKESVNKILRDCIIICKKKRKEHRHEPFEHNECINWL